MLYIVGIRSLIRPGFKTTNLFFLPKTAFLGLNTLQKHIFEGWSNNIIIEFNQIFIYTGKILIFV